MHTYTALFDQQQDAEHAQRELAKLGIVPADNINVSGKDAAGFQADRASDNRTFWDSLKEIFVPQDERMVYEEGLRDGGWLLTVNVDDENSQRVHDVLERSNAVDVDEREAQYRKVGALAAPAASASANTQVAGEQKVAILDEQLKIGKRRVEQGGVRVRSYVVTTPVQKDVTLRDERVVVERHAVNQVVAPSHVAEALRERSVEMSTVKEEAVVAKHARVVEEVSLQREVGERVERVAETVRHTEVDVEHTGGDGEPRITPRGAGS